MSKYRNIITRIDGHRFDSRAEAERYIELKQLEHDGMISNLTLQPRFLLQEAFTHELTGCKHRAIYYVADFAYEKLSGRKIIEDVKGVKTEVFKIKAKLFDYKYPELTLSLIN